MDAKDHFERALELSDDRRFNDTMYEAITMYESDRHRVNTSIEAEMGRLARLSATGKITYSDEFRRAIAHADYGAELLFR